MVAHTLRFDSTIQTVRAHLPEIGPLHALYLSQRFEPSTLAWLDRRAESGGGIVLHTGVHSFDLLRFLTGLEVTRVWCRTAQVVTRETEDSFAMQLGRVAGCHTVRHIIVCSEEDVACLGHEERHRVEGAFHP